VLYDVDIEASACVLSSRYAMLCYAMLITHKQNIKIPIKSTLWLTDWQSAG